MSASKIGTSSTATGSDTAPTISHTVAAGSNRCTYIGVFHNGETINSVATFGGITAELVDNTFSSLNLYRFKNPATGAQTFSCTLSASAAWSVHVITAENVDQTTPNGTAVTATNEELTALAVTVDSAVGELCIAFGSMVSGDIDAGEGSTLDTEQELIDSGFVSSAIVYEAGASPNVTLGLACTASFGDNRIVAISINEAAAAANANIFTGKFGSFLRGKL